MSRVQYSWYGQRYGVKQCPPGAMSGAAGCGEHVLHRPHLFADGVEKRDRLVEQRMHREQGVEIEPHAVVDVASVEGEHRGLAHVEPGTAKDPELDGEVEQEDVLEPGGRLDLDQAPPAPGKALDHVGADQHPFVLEGRLEYRGRDTRLDDLACLLQRLRNVPVVVGDEVTTRKAPARCLADLVAGLEHRLEGLAGRGRQITPIGVVPEPQVALRPRDVAGFRQPEPVVHETADVSSALRVRPTDPHSMWEGAGEPTTTSSPWT